MAKQILKLDSNRLNAQKSTGPKDTASTRFNATKHGLLAEGVTELDNPEGFEGLCAKLQADLQPVGEVEKFLTHRIALCIVRVKRAAQLEAEFTTAQLNPPIVETKIIETGEMTKFMEGQYDVTETIVQDAGLPARLSIEDVGAMIDKFQRYETAIENKLYRAMNQLERMQRQRRGEQIPPPATGDIGVHVTGGPLASFGNPPVDDQQLENN